MARECLASLVLQLTNINSFNKSSIFWILFLFISQLIEIHAKNLYYVNAQASGCQISISLIILPTGIPKK